MNPSRLDENDYERLRLQMVERQLRARGVADAEVLAAMARVPRHRFVGEASRWAAYEDEPLPIGSGQTISQPYMVARMTELAQVDRESRVLEVGTGSGYQAAVLAELAGHVWSIERHPELAERAREILAELGYSNVHVLVGDGSLGLPEEAPFDGIVVTAAAPEVPAALLEQLADGGRLVIPVGASFGQRLRVVRRRGLDFVETDVLGCRFVPLIGAQANPSRERRRVRVLVEGRVQGVWFRDSTRREADRLGVAGWVRNTDDGRVEAVYEGDPVAVEALVAWTRHGPEGALVDGVSVADEAPQGERGFRVIG
ncbi:MAG: protein-L-isoaspartate(D-aspartate) O-methyltransferase [Thermoleophilia bacterium]